MSTVYIRSYLAHYGVQNKYCLRKTFSLYKQQYLDGLRQKCHKYYMQNLNI